MEKIQEYFKKMIQIPVTLTEEQLSWVDKKRVEEQRIKKRRVGRAEIVRNCVKNAMK